MNMLIKKRQLIMAALIVALGAAVFANWYFTRSGGDIAVTEKNPDSEFVQNLGEAKAVNSTVTVPEDTAADYFSEVKLERTKVHDKALEDLKEAARDIPAGVAADSIAKSCDALTAAIKLENDIETLIKAKLGCEAVVVINGEKANAVVAKGALSQGAVLQITDIITSSAGIQPQNIKVTEAK